MNNPVQVVPLFADQGKAPSPADEPRGGPRRRWVKSLCWVLAALVLVGGGSVAWASRRAAFWRGEDPVSRMPRALVSRIDLSSILTAPGRVESSNNTIISCELERLEFRSAGQMIASGGASTILWLVEEGATVKKGDVICRLDASEYEELVRQQQIKADQARAILETGRLNFEVAELAVREYRDGLMKQELQSLEGQIVLGSATLERSSDRLRWSRMMLDKGYIAASARATAERDEMLANLDLQTSQWTLRNLRMFGIPLALKQLQSEVEKRRYEVIANNQRMVRTEERLRYYELMVDRCTIRAPHDGFVIYANDPRRKDLPPVEAGTVVRQGQPLFFLPDLAHMQVSTYLHESVARNVQVGMHARVQIEGLPARTFEGRVISIAPLPSPANWFSDEVKNFIGIVRLDAPPPGILPGMTAEVEVDVDRRLDVLAVPTEAIAVEDGRDICYVAGADGLRRQPVTLGRSDRDFLEVTRGLHEGDQVVLNPTRIESLESMVVHSEPEADGPDEPTGAVAGVATTPMAVD